MTKHILHELTGFVYEYLQDTFKCRKYTVFVSRHFVLFAETNGLARFQVCRQGRDDERARFVENLYGDGGKAASASQDARMSG